ncbi:MAG: GNAT family N-acetyltransferase [archaeon]|jgi:hypothetical protein
MPVEITESALLQWNERIISSEFAHIYHTKEYANVMKKSFGFKPIFFNSEKAMLIGFEQPLKGVAGKIGKGFVAFAPPIFSDADALLELLSAVENECKKRKIISVSIWGSTLWDKPEFFKGFEKVKMQNVVAKLGKSEDELFAALEHAARKNLAKCGETAKNVSEGGAGDLEEYYSNYKAHHESIGLEVYPKEFFDALYSVIISHGLGKFFILRDSDDVFAAGLMIGTFGKSIYELSISSNWEKRHLFPNDVLKWHAMKWANKNEFAQFDLSNIAVDAKEDSKEFNVNRFKKKFGEVIDYNVYKKKLGIAKIFSKLKK